MYNYIIAICSGKLYSMVVYSIDHQRNCCLVYIVNSSMYSCVLKHRETFSLGMQ